MSIKAKIITILDAAWTFSVAFIASVVLICIFAAIVLGLAIWVQRYLGI